MPKAKRGRRAAAWLGPCLVLLMAGAAGAQEAREERHEVQPPEGERERTGRRYEPGVPPEPETTTAIVRGTMAAPASKPDPAGAGRWRTARWVSLEDGEARVVFADGETRVQVGRTIDGDRVRSVRERQLVLERPARADQPGGDGLVIVDFAEGGSRVRVLWSRDPKAVAPTEPR